jgi:hypothetical protein
MVGVTLVQIFHKRALKRTCWMVFLKKEITVDVYKAEAEQEL